MQKTAIPTPSNKPKNFKLLNWLCVIGIVLSVILGFIAATQIFALKCNYQAALGTHHNHFYMPWKIIIWFNKYGMKYQKPMHDALYFGFLVAVMGSALVWAIKIAIVNTARAHANLHGSAKWATKKDIINAGLLPRELTTFEKFLRLKYVRKLYKLILGCDVPQAKDLTAKGVFVGSWIDEKGNEHYLRDNGPAHVFTYAPTRSGKGVGLVLPTMLSWEHSVFINDIKGELWALTAGWRQKYANNKVLRFEPACSEDCAKWNPLDEVRLGTDFEVGDVQNLTMLIVDPDGKGLKDHWAKTSFALLTGVVLHALYRAKHEGHNANLASVAYMLSDPSRESSELWKEMKTYPHINGEPHPLIAAAGQDMAERPEEERGSVLSTAKSFLDLYRDPVVASNTATSDFCVKDLMHHDNPVSLYVITNPDDKDRLKPIVRLLVNMTVRKLAGKMEFADGSSIASYKHRLLMMIDEFPSLGKLEIMEESLAFVAGYGIKCYLITQNTTQLKKAYGQNESITANCHVQNAYPPNKYETAEELSRLSGQTTIIKENISTSGKRAGIIAGQVTRSYQETQRPLLTPDEAMRLKGPIRDATGQKVLEAGDMLIFVAGFPAIYGRQSLYFQDRYFNERSKISNPAQTDVINAQNHSQQETFEITNEYVKEWLEAKQQQEEQAKKDGESTPQQVQSSGTPLAQVATPSKQNINKEEQENSEEEQESFDENLIKQQKNKNDGNATPGVTNG